MDVNAAEHTDTQSGGYRVSAWESQTGQLIDQGNWNDVNFSSGVFDFQEQQAHSGFINDVGRFGGSDTDTGGSSSSANALFIQTTVYHGTMSGAVTITLVQSDPADPTSGTTTGQAGAAPVDNSVGGGGAEHPVYTVTASDVNPDAAGGAWDSYLSNVGQTAKGYFWDAPTGMVTGLGRLAWNTVTDFKGTVKGAARAAMNPGATWNAIKSSYAEKLKTPAGQGAVAFEAVTAALTAGQVAYGLAGKAGIIGRSAAAAEAAEVAAEGTALAESAAQASLVALEGSVPRAHFLARHSPLVSDAELLRRATTGILPTGQASYITNATRFLSYADMKKAIDLATAAFKASPTKTRIPIDFGRTIGVGFYTNGVRAVTSKVIVTLNSSGLPVSAFPTLP